MIEIRILLTESEAVELEQSLLLNASCIERTRKTDPSPVFVERASALESLTVKYLAAVA